eukprot:353225-Chlamydomonas_euryale.AAC.5
MQADGAWEGMTQRRTQQALPTARGGRRFCSAALRGAALVVLPDGAEASAGRSRGRIARIARANETVVTPMRSLPFKRLPQQRPL